MPTPVATIEKLAAALGNVDPANADEVERFYVEIFPTFNSDIREEIFDFLSTLDREASEATVSRFVSKIKKRSDFAQIGERPSKSKEGLPDTISITF